MTFIDTAFEMRDVLKRLIGGRSIEWLKRPTLQSSQEQVSVDDLIAAIDAVRNFNASVAKLSEGAETVELRNELAKYVRLVNTLYNKGGEAKETIVQTIGIQHSPIAAMAEFTAPKG